MRPDQAPDADPLDDDASAPAVADDAVTTWFLPVEERGNPATDLRLFSTGNLVRPLVDGAEYFPRLCSALGATDRGDEIYLLDFRGDLDERLDGAGTEVGSTLVAAARRGVAVFGLLWRSQPGWMAQSEEANAEFSREVSDNGGEILLDARTRRAGSHHQKLVVIRYRKHPERDVAFVGGIDLGHSRHDDARHLGDPQVMDFPAAYGPTPPWHDLHAEVRGPAVHDLEHSFRERWYGSSALDIPSPLRQLYDRAYHASAMTGRPLPDPAPVDDTPVGTHAVQVLRTYPARLRRYPFAPHGERSIAHAYRRALAAATRLVYIEDQYFWSRSVGGVIADALHRSPELRVVVVVPRFPDQEGRVRETPARLGHRDALRACERAGPGRFAVYDLENAQGGPVYVHSKAVVIDDVWAIIGSDNLNRRSWTHDSELSIAVLDETLDPRGTTTAADDTRPRVLARDTRLRLWCEHLGREESDVDDLIDATAAFETFAAEAQRLQAWYDDGRAGRRPPARVLPHAIPRVPASSRAWAGPLYRVLYDPDGRALRDRIRRRG